MARKKVIEVKAEEEEKAALVVEKTTAPKKKSTKATKAAKTEEAAAPQEEIDAFDVAKAPAPADGQEPTAVEQELEDQGEEFKEEIQEERFYVIPLANRGFLRTPMNNRAKKAISVIRHFLTRHMKPEGDVYIAQEVNERVWEYGIRKPPRKIRVRVTKSVDGIVRAYLG